MINETTILTDSCLARIDTRLKVIFVVVFSFAVALSYRWSSLCFALVITLTMISLTTLKPATVLKRLLPACGFLLFLWIALPFTIKGSALVALGPLQLTLEGLTLSGQISIKAITLLLLFMSLTATTSVATIGYALQKLKIPEKLVYLLLFCYRYIFVIEQEYRRLENAIKLRCFVPGTNVHTYRTYAYLVGMLFLRSYLRADQVHKAMICRGFQGRFYSLEQLALRRQDWYWAGTFVIIVLLMTGIEWQTHLF